MDDKSTCIHFSAPITGEYNTANEKESNNLFATMCLGCRCKFSKLYPILQPSYS